MLGISQGSLAQQVGLTTQEVASMEAGKTAVPAKLERKAIAFFNSGGRR